MGNVKAIKKPLYKHMVIRDIFCFNYALMCTFILMLIIGITA